MTGSSQHGVRRVWRRRGGAAALFLTTVLAAVANAVVAAAPVVPSDDSAALERLPRREGEEWSAIAALQTELKAAPRDARLAAELARRYLTQFRAEGDPRLVAYATRAVAAWEGEASLPNEIALTRAVIAQSEHRFAAARAELEALRKRAPRDAEAWLTLATIDTVQGRYAEAREECARLVLLADPLVAGGCFAAVQAVTGEAERAYEFLAARLAESAADEPATLVWLGTLAAELAVGLGLDAAAEEHFEAALAASGSTPSVYLLTTYADWLLRRGEADRVVALLDAAPPADALLLRLARANAERDAVDAAQLERLRYRLELALAGTDVAHAREAAYFALHLQHDAERALRLALDNWSVQREIVDAELVLEAAREAGDASAAAPVLDWLATHNVQDARLARLRAKWGTP